MLKQTRGVAFLAGTIYFTQGALGISGVTMPLFLRGLKWSVAEITAISSIAAFPWLLKIFYGLLSDSYPLFEYRRKSYLFIFSILSAVGWLSLAILPAHKYTILFAMMLTNLGFAATDVVTDGLIVEHSTTVTSSVYQAIAWGSRSFGAVASGALGGWLAGHWVPQHVFLLTMCLPLVVTSIVIWIKEKKVPSAPFATALTPVKRCISLAFTPNLRNFIALLFIASISASFGVPFFFYMKETLKFKETFLGILSSLGWGGAMLGSLIYLKFLRGISPKIVLRWAIVLNCINIFSTLLISNEKSAFILVFISGAMGCLVMLPIMSSAASLTHHSGVEGTLFAILMSIFNLGQIIFGYLGGRFFEPIGLYPLIIITGISSLSALYFVNKLEFSNSAPPSIFP